jgi:RNA-dependent RNA polymerase
MEVFIRHIPYAATEIEIHNYVREILHSPGFQQVWHRGFPMSFKLRLHADRRGKDRGHGGTATLLVPDQRIGQLLLNLRHPPLRGKSLVWALSKNTPNPADIEALSQTPYLAPDQLLERERLERILSAMPKLAALQFGWLDRDDVFSIEWERLYTLGNMTARIEFVSDKREMRVTEAQKLMASGGELFMFLSGSLPPGRRPRIVTTSFSNIESISHAERSDPNPSIVLTFRAPPNFEEAPSGIWTVISIPDNRRRTRKSCMDDLEHARLSPFTSLAMRVIFESREGLDDVLRMARAAKLPSPFTFPSSPVRRTHFSQSDLQWVETWIARLPWQVAYHTTSMLRNLWLSAAELRSFHSRIDQLVEEVQEFHAAEIVRTFGLYLSELSRVSPGPHAAAMIKRKLADCFNRAKKDAEERSPRRRLSDATVLCYHVTVTPTSFMLKGPEVEQVSLLGWCCDFTQAFLV